MHRFPWVCALLAGAAFAADPSGAWPQFRGPGGSGLGDDKASLPAEFGPKKALVWKTPLPLGHGSPCLWGDRIFVTAFDADAKKLEVLAIQRKDGSIVWRQTVPAAEIESVHQVSSPATSTPVTDGERVYVYFGSAGLVAYNWNGSLAWQHPLGVAKSPFGSGASPVLAGDLVLIHRDYPAEPFLLAVRKQDGKLAWKSDLVKSNSPGPKTSHATPVVWKGQIVLNRAGEISAYSPEDGKRLWWLPTASGGTSTPVAADGALYVTAFSITADPAGATKLPPYASTLEKHDKDKDGKLSAAEAPPNDLFFLRRAGVPDDVPGAHFHIKQFFGMVDRNKDGFVDEAEYNGISALVAKFATSPLASGLFALQASGEGDLSATGVKWAEKRSVPEVSAPLAYHGRVYMVTAGGIVTSVDAATGKVVYRGRVNSPGAYYASPVAAGGKIFIASAEGVVSVLAGGETLEVLANNDLGEPIYGTPAPVGSVLYVRSARHLWAFANSQ